MSNILPVMGLAVALAIIAGLLALIKGKTAGVGPYRKQDYFFSKAERSFFEVLRQAAGDEYHIFAKVRLCDVVFVSKDIPDRSERAKWDNKIRQKHLDFLICDRSRISPILAIELDDESHDRPSRQDRDAFLEGCCQTAGLPILRIKAAKAYVVTDISAEIRRSISAGSQQPVIHS